VACAGVHCIAVNLAFAAVAAQTNATARAKMAVDGEAMAPVCVMLVLFFLLT